MPRIFLKLYVNSISVSTPLRAIVSTATQPEKVPQRKQLRLFFLVVEDKYKL